MKVLQINSVCGVGSTGKICQDLYWELKKRGHECKIAWGRRKGGNVPDEDTIQIGRPIDYYWHALSARIFDNTGFCSKRATEKFIQEVKAYDPDVIHLHNIHGYYINIEILFDYLHKCGKKIIWTLHDCWSFTGHCAYMDFIGCSKWKTKCFSCPQKRCYPASFVFDRSYNNYFDKRRIFTNIPNLTIVTPSYWLASLVKQSFLKEYDVIIKKNKIDKTIFKYTASDIRNKYKLLDKIVILSVANIWDERKGLFDVIRLANELDQRLFKIVIIGLSKNQKRKLPQGIIGIERTENQKELVHWYSAADLVFNPTREDNFPTVNLEAEACGTPVISYDTGGCMETLSKSDSKVVKCFSEAIEEIHKRFHRN